MPETSEVSLLIVDDDQMNRDILYLHLVKLGYSNVVLADSGKRALEIIASQPIDLVLLDMMMPVMSGLEVLEQMKAHHQWRIIPVIIISALDEKEMVLACIQKGAEDYLLKPYDRVLLKARISACLTKKSLYDREIINKQKLEAAYEELAIAYYKLEIIKNELEALSNRDGLTGISNRRYFDTTMEKEWNAAHREKRYLSLILFDIDYFKLYNDTYGHLAGDDCLCEVATAAATVIKRPRDTIARYGGEEFAVVLPDTDAAGAVYCAEQIRSHIENLNIRHASSIIADHITASLGVSTINPSIEAATFSQLIKEADLALYQAKREGRNCYRVWSGDER